jgi:hypothetical protein
MSLNGKSSRVAMYGGGYRTYLETLQGVDFKIVNCHFHARTFAVEVDMIFGLDVHLSGKLRSRSGVHNIHSDLAIHDTWTRHGVCVERRELNSVKSRVWSAVLVVSDEHTNAMVWSN